MNLEMQRKRWVPIVETLWELEQVRQSWTPQQARPV
jgi:hypothetical protein